MKKMNIKRLLIKGILPFTTALTMSSFSAMSAQASSSKVVKDSFIEEESIVSEDLKPISDDWTGGDYFGDKMKEPHIPDSAFLSELEITESMARNYFLDIVFETDQTVDTSKLNDALTTFQPNNQKIDEVAPQVLKYIVSANGSVDDDRAYSISLFPSYTHSVFIFDGQKGSIDYDYFYYDENKKVKSDATLNYCINDNEMDHYDLDCYDQGGWYQIIYYPGLEKSYIWKHIGDYLGHYEKEVPSENMEEFFNTLKSLCISASTESFENNSYLSTPGEQFSPGKVYYLTQLW